MKHLLAISIGPAQDFIAAARRTADLYAGSQILQEVCQAAARTLDEPGATLIFPASAQAAGANKILVMLEGDPQQAAKNAEQAAKKKLCNLWDEAQAGLPGTLRAHIGTQRAKIQLEGFLEFYAAWLPFDGSDYRNKRKEVDRLLAGRKALRDFAWVSQQDDGVPKSPLDPSRAAVFELPKDTNGRVRLEIPQPLLDDLNLNKTEFLDAISLLKRLKGIEDRTGKVPQTRTLARLSWNPDAKNADLPPDDEDTEPEPQPYFAILVADGDKMGDLISQKQTPEEHQNLSKTLDEFAQKAQAIVRDHAGFPVYTGGDDVLAFLPVNQAIGCANKLSDEFWCRVRGTLSAGVAVVHYREPLSISLEAARDAEKAAKNGGRNALAVALHTRGGAPLTVVRKWDSLRWKELQQAYSDKKITQGLAYELHKLALEWQDDMGGVALTAEAGRILGRKERQELKLPDFENRQDLLTYANQLVIARFLSGIATDDKQGATHA